MITNELPPLPPQQQERISNSSILPVIWDLVPENELLTRNPFAMQPVRMEIPMSASIFVKVDFRYKRIRMEDIYLLEAKNNYINIYTKEKRHTVLSTMYGILEKLPK